MKLTFLLLLPALVNAFTVSTSSLAFKCTSKFTRIRKTTTPLCKNLTPADSGLFAQRPQPRHATTQLHASGDDLSDGPSPSLNLNLTYAALWASLLAFAFLFSPGELNSPADTALINELLTNPVSPDCNHLWFMIWNFFAVAPLSLAALLLPGSSTTSKLPATPFVAASAALGYFALGPFMITRNPTEGTVSTEELGFFTKNIFESKIFAALLTLLTASIPFSSGVVSDVISGNGSSLISGFIDLFQSSKFVSVASVDIGILTALAAVLIPEDMERRGMEPSKTAGFSTLLLPVVGPCIYFILRDKLED